MTPEAGEEVEAPACPPEPRKREIVRVTRATIKEKGCAFSSVGSSSCSGKNERSEDGRALSAAVFKGFHSSASAARVEDSGAGEKAREDGNGDGGGRFDMVDIETWSSWEPWRKRKSPFGDGHEEHGSSAKRVVVLGDDPRPVQPLRERRRVVARRGVDGEEVGWTDDMWEGIGSVTLGGLEWH